jgi:hypothetical protein
MPGLLVEIGSHKFLAHVGLEPKLLNLHVLVAGIIDMYHMPGSAILFAFGKYSPD